MMSQPMSPKSAPRLLALVSAVVIAGGIVSAQTKITAPHNKYTPAEDVKLGREAAAEVRKQLPIMTDDLVSSYISNLGRRLADVIPNEYQHSEFRYTFDTVNVREINAF